MSERVKDPSSMHEIASLKMKFKDPTQKHVVKWYTYTKHYYNALRKHRMNPHFYYQLEMNDGLLYMDEAGDFFIGNRPWVNCVARRVFANRTGPRLTTFVDVVAWRFVKEKSPNLPRRILDRESLR